MNCHQILYFNATDLKLGSSTYLFLLLSFLVLTRWVGHVTSSLYSNGGTWGPRTVSILNLKQFNFQTSKFDENILNCCEMIRRDLFFSLQSYANCSCVVTQSEAWGEVHSGACGVNCRLQLVLFVALSTLIVFLSFVNDTPAYIVTLR